ncbi:MAG: cytochrome c family protein [Sulfurimonas sp.]|nr:cytochrome c family protein [Sulfurimonas sp.]
MLNKILLYMSILFVINASAELTTNETCKMCHPQIYKEYKASAHSKATIYSDEIHKSIWNIHPLNKKQKYECAVCHTPGDVRILKALKEGKPAMPRNDKAHKEAISCITCHSIKSIKKNPKTHDEIILVDNDKKRPVLFSADEDNRDNDGLYERKTTIFGMFKSKSRSPYHDVIYNNDIFYTGKVCLGCHAHKENTLGLNICTTDEKGAIKEDSNCITCHMPKVEGSFAKVKMSKKHSFHGFAGYRNKPEMLAKYLKMSFKQTKTGFDVTFENEAKHNLLLHPLRLGVLNVTVHKGSKEIKEEPIFYYRILGTDGKPSMPWLATEVVKENMLKAEEIKTYKYNTIVEKGDKVEVEFGFYLVNPKMIEKLNLTKSEEATKYNVLKTKTFEVLN